MLSLFSPKQIVAGLAVPVGFILMIVGFFVSGLLALFGGVMMVGGAYISFRLFNPVNQLGAAMGQLDQALKSDEFQGLMKTMQETVDQAHDNTRRHQRHIDDSDDDES